MKVAPEFEHAPPLLYTTGNPELLAAATAKFCLYVAVAGAVTDRQWLVVDNGPTSDASDNTVFMFENPSTLAMIVVGTLSAACVAGGIWVFVRSL